MSKYNLILLAMFAFVSLVSPTSAEQKNEMEAYFNPEYGLKFLYPKSWELRAIPDPFKRCDYEIRLRPPSWLTRIEAEEYRRYSDFPLQIVLCPENYISQLKSNMYQKTANGWVSVAKGIEMDTSDVSGKGWQGIVGDVPYKTTTKTGEQGPESFLEQAIISIGNKKSIILIMEHMKDYQRENMKEPWELEDLLLSLEVSNRYKGAFIQTSYDCKTSKSKIEKTICINKDLAKADKEMNAVYKTSLSKVSKDQKNKLRQAQRKWLKERNLQCDSEQIYECLEKKYSERISELKSLK